MKVIKRDGTVVEMNPQKIIVAMGKAFVVIQGEGSLLSQHIRDSLDDMTKDVLNMIVRRGASSIHVEDIQDLVELALMRAGHHKEAKEYVLYREKRNAERRAKGEPIKTIPQENESRIFTVIEEACYGLSDVDANLIIEETRKNYYSGITEKELSQAAVMAARTLIEKEPNYSFVCARLLLDTLREEALTLIYGVPCRAKQSEMTNGYADYFPKYIHAGVQAGFLDRSLEHFNLQKLGAAIVPDRDWNFQFLGLQTLYDRYFLHQDGVRFELPQAFFMRVAMGLAINEDNPDQRAIEFYEVLSQFKFMSSTPTLFNSGTTRPQMSSCFLTTVPDDLKGIFKTYSDNALLSKFAGGLGNDWTPVRGLGSHIKGTNGKSQGVVPFLKVANDTAVAVNQGGKRKGAVCAYLETWHIDIEEFLDLRKNTGDERRRTHDMNTANWIPDLFMQRVEADAEWTLFSPDEVPHLHDLYGSAFKTAYEEAEHAAIVQGKIKVWKRMRAVTLWRKMLTMLFETGHPWITFKDPCNIRSPQGHVGVVHSSNLCTEITLNTNKEEVAVCNLGSINLSHHVVGGKFDWGGLTRTVMTAMRMLDNVIDVNYYNIPEAKTSNGRHRPVGLGIMGFHDALYKLRVPYGSERAIEIADVTMEAISYAAINASVALARERGHYETFPGSLWSLGVLPIDSIALLKNERGGQMTMDATARLPWKNVRDAVMSSGVRNSNMMAIAPTATIANICGVSQSIEPTFRNLYTKSNLSGEFTVINPYLVADLKDRGLWDDAMIADLKYYDGSVIEIERIPADLKELYKTAFEIPQDYLILAASRRQKWIDQAQSLNLYLDKPSGKDLDQLYKFAWRSGLKTTYYLRTQAATQVEKSTLKGTDGKLNAVSADVGFTSRNEVLESEACSIDNPECEACQ